MWEFLEALSEKLDELNEKLQAKKEEQKLTVTHKHNWLGLVGLIFVMAKLLGYVNWSWWIVLAPFWAPYVIVLAFLLVVLLLAGLIYLVGFTAIWLERWMYRRNRRKK